MTDALDKNRITDVLTRLDKGFGPDRDLDWDIAEALGGMVRRVSRLGLNGRSPGSWRVFWSVDKTNGKGSVIPYYTKHRDKAKDKLRKVLEQSE